MPDGWALAGIRLIVASGLFGTWLIGCELLHPASAGEARPSIEAIAGADER